MLYEIEPHENDSDYPQIIADYTTEIPSRTRALLYNEEPPTSKTIHHIRNLEMLGVDYTAIPCNSIHYWYDEISKKIERPWINMLNAMKQKANDESIERPLIVGGYVTIEKNLYDGIIDNPIYLSKKENKIIFNVILNIKKQKSFQSTINDINDIIHNHKNEIDSVILSCTELSLVMPHKHHMDIDIFDSVNVYAEKCLEVLRYGL